MKIFLKKRRKNEKNGSKNISRTFIIPLNTTNTKGLFMWPLDNIILSNKEVNAQINSAIKMK